MTDKERLEELTRLGKAIGMIANGMVPKIIFPATGGQTLEIEITIDFCRQLYVELSNQMIRLASNG